MAKTVYTAIQLQMDWKWDKRARLFKADTILCTRDADLDANDSNRKFAVIDEEFTYALFESLIAAKVAAPLSVGAKLVPEGYELPTTAVEPELDEIIEPKPLPKISGVAKSPSFDFTHLDNKKEE